MLRKVKNTQQKNGKKYMMKLMIGFLGFIITQEYVNI